MLNNTSSKPHSTMPYTIFNQTFRTLKLLKAVVRNYKYGPTTLSAATHTLE